MIKKPTRIMFFVRHRYELENIPGKYEKCAGSCGSARVLAVLGQFFIDVDSTNSVMFFHIIKATDNIHPTRCAMAFIDNDENATNLLQKFIRIIPLGYVNERCIKRN